MALERRKGLFRADRESLLVATLGMLTVTVVVFFCAHFVATRLERRLSILDSGVLDVYPIGGLAVRFDAGLDAGAGSMRVVPGGRQLVFVGADSCPLTAEDLPRWRRLVQTLEFEAGDMVTVVGVGPRMPEELRAAAAARGVAFRTFSVSDMAAWIATTGITATPKTMVLDEQGRIRLQPQRSAGQDYEVVRRFFDEDGGWMGR